MRNRMLICMATSVALAAASLAYADEVPDKQPFDIPYGTPITLEQAMKAGEAARAEAEKRGWKLAIAVVVPSGELIYFMKLNGTQYGATMIAEHKARVAAKSAGRPSSSRTCLWAATASRPISVSSWRTA